MGEGGELIPRSVGARSEDRLRVDAVHIALDHPHIVAGDTELSLRDRRVLQQALGERIAEGDVTQTYARSVVDVRLVNTEFPLRPTIAPQ